MALQVLHKHVPCRQQEQSLFLTAVENTWIHARQKKRKQKRQLREVPRAPHCAAPSSQTNAAAAATASPSRNKPPSTQDNQDDDTHNQTSSAQEQGDEQQPAEQIGNGSSSNVRSAEVTNNTSGEQKEALENIPGEDVDMDSVTCTAATCGPLEAPAEASEPPSKPLSPGTVEHFLLKCLLNVMLNEGDVVIKMHWVEGHNKDLLNQLCTYLKNTLLKSVA